MLFTSVSFLLFFLLTAIVHRILPGRLRWVLILLASAAFYASFLPAYLAVLALAALASYFAGLGIEGSTGRARKGALFAGVGVNLLLLVFFKYSSFFDACAASAARVLDLRYSEGMLRAVLPLGFSFFVFTAISYLVEIERGKTRAERHPGILAVHFLFFPKLAQGPIERPQNLLPQIREARSATPDEIAAGFRRMLLGCFKKLVVADRLAIYVNAVYGNEPLHNGSSLLLATLFYSFQIYADFSGYTDIALGSAEVLGFRLTPNFKRPYLAGSISEFWNRWHMSLSTWLRDYLFLPLAYFFANRAARPSYLRIRSDKWVYLFAVMITFVLCGAWHGEGWNFVLWGGLFGVYLTVSNWSRKLRRGAVRRTGLARLPRLHTALRTLFTFSLVTLAWVFFRGGDLATIGSIFGKFVAAHGRPFLDSPSTMIYSFFGIAAILAIDVNEEFFGDRFGVLAHRSAAVRATASAALIVGILLFGVLDGGQFIYFQF
jgi:D-alanyl-lipoteichoic acid acyltransferase DltB (MBOAT superfamily)